MAAFVMLGSAWMAFAEKGREIPHAVKANDAVRAQLATRVAAARAENARRLAAHRVTVRIPVEDR